MGSWWTKGVNPPETDWWAEDEPRFKIKPKTRDEIIAEIKKRNSFRWWRLNYDYKWLRKQMKKMGYNPDEARELLP